MRERGRDGHKLAVVVYAEARRRQPMQPPTHGGGERSRGGTRELRVGRNSQPQRQTAPHVAPRRRHKAKRQNSTPYVERWPTSAREATGRSVGYNPPPRLAAGLYCTVKNPPCNYEYASNGYTKLQDRGKAKEGRD